MWKSDLAYLPTYLPTLVKVVTVVTLVIVETVGTVTIVVTVVTEITVVTVVTNKLFSPTPPKKAKCDKSLKKHSYLGKTKQFKLGNK